jgi:hypothetical protein
MQLMVDVCDPHAVVRAIGDCAGQRVHENRRVEPAAERDAELRAGSRNEALDAGEQS